MNVPLKLQHHKDDRTRRLLDLLSSQKSLVDQLMELARRQGAAVRNEDADALLDLLARRQRIIDDIAGIQREISPLLSPHERESGASAEMQRDDRARAAELISQIESGLAGVMKCDDDAQECIRVIQDRGRSEVKTFGQTQQARKAYGPQCGAAAAPHAPPRFSDRKG